MQIGTTGRAVHVKELRRKLDVMREQDRIKDGMHSFIVVTMNNIIISP